MLEDQKLLSRTHGGALAQDVAYELPVRYRGGRNRDQKRRIAAAAAALLPKGPLTMGLTGGTTTSEVARLIADRVDVTLVTNALNIATELALRPRLKIIVTGGVSRPQSYELVGPLAEQTLTGLHMEVAVVGVDGISADAGLTTHDEVEAHTNRAMVARAAAGHRGRGRVEGRARAARPDLPAVGGARAHHRLVGGPRRPGRAARDGPRRARRRRVTCSARYRKRAGRDAHIDRSRRRGRGRGVDSRWRCAMSHARGARRFAAGAVAVLAMALPSCPPGGGTPPPPAPVRCAGHCWHPALKTSWDWVLSVVPQAPYRSVEMYDIDGFDTTAGDVAAMHAAGIKVVCYLSAGTFENWRPDAAAFPASVKGKANGWPGEKWLDVRELQKPHSRLRAIMDTRLDMCRTKGFDAVELDNVDGYTNSTGFPVTAADQLFYNATLANDAHARGLSVLQKNDNEQIPQLLPYFDAALNEQCNQYQECTTAQNGSFGLDQYVAAGKAVFQAEYSLAREEVLRQGQRRELQRSAVQRRPGRLPLPPLPVASAP